jgi:copper chaperone
MIAFTVNDMTCGHCVGTVTRAIEAVDPGARVTVDLAAHRVVIEPRATGAEALVAAITEAGYTPVAVAPATPGA